MKIYVIDDNEIDLWIAEHLIRQVDEKVSIYTFNTVRKALNKLARQEVVDLIILDLHLPIESGLQFLVEYKKYEVKHSPIVILTNSLNKEEQKFFLHHYPISDYLKKPLTKAMITNLLHNVHTNNL